MNVCREKPSFHIKSFGQNHFVLRLLIFTSFIFAFSGCTNGIINTNGSNFNNNNFFVNWLNQLGQISMTTVTVGVVTDSSGNSYIAGRTSGNLASCNGVSASCSGPAQGTNDYFISKYSSSGAWVWTRQLGELSMNTLALGVAIDGSSNIFIYGETNGNLVSCNGVSSSCSGPSSGTQDYFISKYNSNGDWISTIQLGEISKGILATGGISIDSSGYVYVGGSTTGNLQNCSGVSGSCGGGSSTGTQDYYISKYDNNLTWQWTKQMGETSKIITLTGVTTDPAGNILIGGHASGDLIACGGVAGSCGGSSSRGSTDLFIAKYSGTGIWSWTQQLGETGFATQSQGIKTDALSNVYVFGQTNGNLPTCGGTYGACGGTGSAGLQDYYVAKYSSAGSYLWMVQLGQTSQTSVAQALAIDSANNIYVAGKTTGNLASCNGSSANCTGFSRGTYDFFFSKYDSNGGNWKNTIQLGETSATTMANGAATDNNGHIIIAGNTTGFLPSCQGQSTNCAGISQGVSDYFITKY